MRRFPPDNLFFTADTHFRHANILKYCNRPYADVEQMDEDLIRRWNAVVPEGATVFHLGDFGLGLPHELLRIRERLNGRVYLIRGNHDEQALQVNANWRNFKNLSSLRIPPFLDVYETLRMRVGDGDGDAAQRLFLSHYAHRSWPGKGEGAWNLHGHSHGNLPRIPGAVDVGVDVWDYAPVSFEKLRARMNDYTLQTRRPAEGVVTLIGAFLEKYPWAESGPLHILTGDLNLEDRNLLFCALELLQTTEGEVDMDERWDSARLLKAIYAIPESDRYEQKKDGGNDDERE